MTWAPQLAQLSTWEPALQACVQSETPVATCAAAPARSIGGSEVVSVQSSLRCRSADSTAARAMIRHIFAMRRKYSEVLAADQASKIRQPFVTIGDVSSTQSTPPPPTGLRRMAAALTYRDFRVLWLGAFVSTIGTWMQKVAQSWLVLTLAGTASAFYLGLDSFLGELPILLFTLIGGVVADRRDRRQLLLASQYVQMATALTLAALVYFDSCASGTCWRSRSLPASPRRSAAPRISR